MPNTTQVPLTDQLAHISPVIIVCIVMGFTLVRLMLNKVRQPWARTVSETCDTINFVLVLAFLLITPFVAQAFYIPSESMMDTLLKDDRLMVDKFSYRLHEPRRHDVVVFNAPPEAEREDGVDYIKRLIGMPGDTLQVRGARMTLMSGERIEPSQYAEDPVRDYLRPRLGIGRDDSIKIFPDHLLINGKQLMDKRELAEKLGTPGGEIKLEPGQTIINGKVQDEPYTREDPGYDFPNDSSGPVTILPGHFFMMGDNRNRSRDSHAWGQLDRSRVVGHGLFIYWPPSRMRVIK